MVVSLRLCAAPMPCGFQELLTSVVAVGARLSPQPPSRTTGRPPAPPPPYSFPHRPSTSPSTSRCRREQQYAKRPCIAILCVGVQSLIVRAVLRAEKMNRVRNANRNEPSRGRSLLHGQGMDTTQDHGSTIEQCLAVGGGWWLVAVDGGRWLAVVGGSEGLCLRAVLNAKKKSFGGQPC